MEHFIGAMEGLCSPDVKTTLERTNRYYATFVTCHKQGYQFIFLGLEYCQSSTETAFFVVVGCG